ncbi:hypothetical protein G9A89_023475 [Geosiphon pyriformis]|nr:hypothetical protein G9A89_023475 [Geosiphon pyriformis]
MKTISSLVSFLIVIITFSSLVILVPSVEGACGALNVFQTCKAGQAAELAKCPPADWACQCQKNKDLYTCYLQCPNDPTISAEGQALVGSNIGICNAADNASSISAAKTKTSTSTTSTSSTTTTGTLTSTSSSSSSKSTSTESSSSPTPTKNAAPSFLKSGNGFWFGASGLFLAGILPFLML